MNSERFSERKYIKLYNEGKKDEEIAEIFGLHVETVKDLRKNLDLEKRNCPTKTKKDFNAGNKTEKRNMNLEIENHLPLPIKVPRRFDVKKFLSLYCKGETDKYIASFFRMDLVTIGKIRRGFDLESINSRGKQIKWTKEKIIEDLKKLHKKLGREPLSKDDTPLVTATYTYFGSFVKAKKIAGIEITKKGKFLYSKKKIVGKMREISERKGSVIEYQDDMELSKAAVNAFGSWWAAKKAAKLLFFNKKEEKEIKRSSEDNTEIAFLAKRFLDLFYEDRRDEEFEKIVKPLCQKLEFDFKKKSLEELRERSHQFLLEHPRSFLVVQDGWAKETFQRITKERIV
jgi:hypothetical protein